MNARLLFTAIVFCFIGVSSVFSQLEENPLEPSKKGKPIYIGPVAGYNRALHSADLATFAWDVDNCPTFTNGSSNGFFAGISFEYLIGDPRTTKSSIIARVLYNVLPGYFEESGDMYPSIIPTTGEIVNSRTKNTVDVTYNLATVEVMYKFNPIQGSGLGITAGPTFDFAMSRNITQKYMITEPNNVQFINVQGSKPEEVDARDNLKNTLMGKGYGDAEAESIIAGLRYEDTDRTIIVRDGDIPDALGKGSDGNSFRIGIKAALQYELNFKKFYVVPSIAYNFGVTNLSSSENWKVSAIQIGVDVRFAIGNF